MRRLAAPAAFVCFLTVTGLALSTAALAADLDGGEAACPRGPRTVASHTGLQQSRDGQAVSIQFALEEGCDDVEVSLLSYHFTAGPGSAGHAEQVLYDVNVARASAGQVGGLEVAVMPECWSLTKLVVGRPPTGGLEQLRDWERANTVYSKWDGGASACGPESSSPLEDDPLLGALLGPPGSGVPADQPPGTDPGSAQADARPGGAATRSGTAQGGSPSAGTPPPATDPQAGGAARQGLDGGAVERRTGLDLPATGPTVGGGRSTERSVAASGSGREVAADGALPITGTPVGNVLIAAIGLVMAGAVLLRLGRRYHARHLAS